MCIQREGVSSASTERASQHLTKRSKMRLLFGVSLIVTLAVAAAVYFMMGMPGKSRNREPGAPIDRGLEGRLRSHIQHLAGEIGERHFRRGDTLDRSLRYIERAFSSLDYESQRLAYRLPGGYTFYNLESDLEGTNRPNEIIVIGAHYDTVPGTPGADDNASGSAALIELARLLKAQPLERTVRFVAFVNEEEPFHSTQMGSGIYARAARERGVNIIGMLSLESIGYYDDRPNTQHYPRIFQWFYPSIGSFVAFVGNLKSRPLLRKAIRAFRVHTAFPSEGVVAPERLVPDIGRSDHSSFWREGYPAIMVTDTVPFRNPNYHRPSDTPETLRYDYMSLVVQGLAKTIADLANEGD
ncbi:MAG: M28 family peptidase [Gammaproteobacteria bacterium]